MVKMKEFNSFNKAVKPFLFIALLMELNHQRKKRRKRKMLMKAQTVSEFIQSWVSESDTVMLIDERSNTEIDVFQASDLLDSDFSDCLITKAKLRYHFELTIIDDTHPYESDEILSDWYIQEFEND